MRKINEKHSENQYDKYIPIIIDVNGCNLFRYHSRDSAHSLSLSLLSARNLKKKQQKNRKNIYTTRYNVIGLIQINFYGVARVRFNKRQVEILYGQ